MQGSLRFRRPLEAIVAAIIPAILVAALLFGHGTLVSLPVIGAHGGSWAVLQRSVIAKTGGAP